MRSLEFRDSSEPQCYTDPNKIIFSCITFFIYLKSLGVQVDLPFFFFALLPFFNDFLPVLVGEYTHFIVRYYCSVAAVLFLVFFLSYSCVSSDMKGLRESVLCTDLDVLHIRCSLLAAGSSDFFDIFFSFDHIFPDAFGIFAKRTVTFTVHTLHPSLFLIGIHINNAFNEWF